MPSLLQEVRLDDEDSLFGSPPPSPGRSPSPALALPSSTGSGIGLSATQNVGTIALPGSHPFSELPLNPLALPLSLQQAPRPPAHSNVSQGPVYNHVSHAAAGSTSSSPAPSRSSSQGPPVKIKKRVMRTKSKESTPRPGPEIALPDPSAPPPAHFLRNQTALLGTAGLVGGVKPANLSVLRHTRGATSSNPIVVEDEDDTPTIGRNSGFRQPYQQPIDPALLPAPSNQDIVSMLIGQKDIFPVLESILKLIAAGSTHQPSQPQTHPQGFQHRKPPQQQPWEQSQVSRPVKKRKLNRVPAGATDWDVPYPFEQGEGPDAYRSTWERERGKQLISQLVGLIKTAARKAATKNYLQSQETRKLGPAEMDERKQAADAARDEEVRLHGYYKPETAAYGLDQRATAQQGPEVLADASNGRKGAQPSTVTVAQPRPLTLPETQPQTPFDQLISSLLAASPDHGVGATSSPHIALNQTNTPLYLPPGASGSTEQRTVQSSNEGVDQALFESWMNVLQAFPVPSGGFSQPQQVSSSDGGPPPSFDDFGFFDPSLPCFDLNGNFEEGSSSFIPTGIGSNGMSIDDNVNQRTVHAPVSQSAELDYLIDPELLEISKPNNTHSSGESLPISLAPSPIPSTSSLGDSDPKTPTSAGWDITFPGVYLGGSAMLEDSLRPNGVSHRRQGLHESDTSTSDLMLSTGGYVDKGKGREVMPSATSYPSSTVVDAKTAAFRALLGGQKVDLYPPLTTSMPPTSLRPKPPLALKEEVLRRGRERKRRLEEELQSVRLQLWETTIEQAALSHLVD